MVVVTECPVATPAAISVVALALRPISTYGFTCDLPAIGDGMAWLHSEFVRLGSQRERVTIDGRYLAAAPCGVMQQASVDGAGRSPAGLWAIPVFPVASAIVLRRAAT